MTEYAHHWLIGSQCSCGWPVPLGVQIMSAFTRHLVDMQVRDVLARRFVVVEEP